MKTRCLILFFAASITAFAGDWEFDHVVKAIEQHYGVKRTHIPFMGLASLVVKVGHPAGASDFKLAVFEDLRSSNDPHSQARLDQFMNEVSGGGLHPLVRVRSRRDGESTYIFAGDAGKSTRLLIATFERDEATVIEVKVDMDTLLRTINSPEHAGKAFSE